MAVLVTALQAAMAAPNPPRDSRNRRALLLAPQPASSYSRRDLLYRPRHRPTEGFSEPGPVFRRQAWALGPQICTRQGPCPSPDQNISPSSSLCSFDAILPFTIHFRLDIPFRSRHAAAGARRLPLIHSPSLSFTPLALSIAVSSYRAPLLSESWSLY